MHRTFKTVSLSALAALTLVAPATASACGGFFCSQAPMDQVGEHILFSVDGTRVTAHIQIQYEGEAEAFSWVLPLPAEPTLGVGTDVLFQRLRQVTDPRFEIDWQSTPDCQANNYCQADASTELDGDGSPNAGGGGVVVVNEGVVGPFEFKVVKGESGEALYTWLNDNGYDQPEEAMPIVEHYVAQDYYFLALRLQSDKGVGDLQPVVVDYESDQLACVPLRLTKIAAAEDMPVYSWVLAKARAIPINYFHVVLNAKAYPWLDCATPSGWGWFGGSGDCATAYTDLVTEAANAANGHAFVTEFAGDSAVMADQIYPSQGYDLDALKAAQTPGAWMQELMNQSVPRTPLAQEIIRTWIPKPASVAGTECESDSSFYSTWGIDDCVAQYMPEGWTFEPVGLTDDLQERVLEPMEQAQKLFQTHTYLTRVFTTISPDEMTKDPMFSFNPDLPAVSNVHTVTAKPICEGKDNVVAVEITYADGQSEIVEGTIGSCSPFQPTDGSTTAGQPAVAEIQVLGESGAPEIVAPGDVATREPELDTRVPTPNQANVVQNPAPRDPTMARTGTFATPPASPVTDSGSTGSSNASSGCTAAARSPGATGLALALGLIGVAWVLLRRRTRLRRKPIRFDRR